MRGGINIVTPLDQFIVQNPDDFFGSSSAHAHIQLDNLEILVNHLKCAAFELPISPDEQFGNVDLPALCEELGETGFLHQSGGDFVIIDTTGEDRGKPEVIGEIDSSSVLRLSRNLGTLRGR